jgi:hypothetical protein
MIDAALREGRTTAETARSARTGAHSAGVHSTGDMAATEAAAVASSKTRMAAETAAMSATRVTSTMLRP